MWTAFYFSYVTLLSPHSITVLTGMPSYTFFTRETV